MARARGGRDGGNRGGTDGRQIFQSPLFLVVAGAVYKVFDLFMAPFLGNEPMAGFLSASAIVMAIGLWIRDDLPKPYRQLGLLGAVSGCAFLTKVSAGRAQSAHRCYRVSHGPHEDRADRGLVISQGLALGGLRGRGLPGLGLALHPESHRDWSFFLSADGTR